MGLNMNEHDKLNIKIERLSLLIGTIVGQLSGLLNQLGRESITLAQVYRELLDLNEMAGLQLHELYYKNNKRDEK